MNSYYYSLLSLFIYVKIIMMMMLDEEKRQSFSNVDIDFLDSPYYRRSRIGRKIWRRIWENIGSDICRRIGRKKYVVD